MRTCTVRSLIGIVLLCAPSLGIGAQTTVQSAPLPSKDIPRIGSTPDLSGVWNLAPSGHAIARDFQGFRETLPEDKDRADLFTYRHSPYPMQPWAAEKFEYNKNPSNPYGRGRAELDPFTTLCAPEGVSQKWQDVYPFEIIQTPKRILIVFESNHEIRQIWTDGRQHPKDFGHNWVGHSIGRWEGDVLVVDTIGLNDLTWLDKAGHNHSDALHLVERLQRVAANRLSLSVTFDDPKTFTMPWSSQMDYVLKPSWEIEEAVDCDYKLQGHDIPLR